MKNKYAVLFVCLLMAPSLLAQGNLEIGWIEKVAILPQGIMLDAKIDTGADNSSIDVESWEIINQAGNQLVKFVPAYPGHDGEILQLPLKKITRVKSKCPSEIDMRIERPVVMMKLCLAGKTLTVPVNLAKRAAFKYRMLIGRSALKQRFVVNSGEKYMHPAICQ